MRDVAPEQIDPALSEQFDLQMAQIDAINQADIYRFVFGNDFVDTNAVIIKQNNERLA